MAYWLRVAASPAIPMASSPLMRSLFTIDYVRIYIQGGNYYLNSLY